MKTNYLKIFLPASVFLLFAISCKKSPSPPLVIPPTITSISPMSGAVGTTVTITGTNFGSTPADNTVKFNGVATVVSSATATSLVVNAPATGTTGKVSVSTINGSANGPTFTYIAASPPPTITSIAPTSGVANTIVTITGTNFKATTTDDTVKINGVAAIVKTASISSLTVAAPAGGSTGIVTVTTSNGSAPGPVFTYLLSPTITSISPTLGVAGTSVTIAGTNFDAISANDTIKFNGVKAVVNSATSSTIITSAPATGSSGNVTVTTNGGTSNGVLFTYNAGPTVYISGSQTDGNNGYWSNSTFTNIAACVNPASIAVSGNDVYLAGGANTLTPTYWKNGIAVQVSAQTGYMRSIFISGTDIYGLGLIGTSLVVWKNNVASNLTGSASLGSNPGGNHALFVSGSDVYVAGWQLGPGIYYKATYWKNGIPVFLTPGLSGNAEATAIYAVGTDVYVAGTEEELSGGGLINKAPRLWKNGISVPLTTPANSLFNSVTSVLVSGSDVYVGGQYNGSGAVWKNGTMVNTASYALAEQVTAMFLQNNTDLYISGSSSSSGMNGYWKNGSIVEMDPGCTVAGPGCTVTTANNVTAIYVK